jgi:sulfonate transport system substrate-binding protein
MDRRNAPAAILGAALVPAPRHAFAQNNPEELRVGYQKTGVLVIARQQGVLERRFAKLGIAVKWVEFTSGPPLLEAMNVGSIDLGAVGDSPPIFAQAAGAAIVYVAGAPINNGQAILVKPESPIRSLADLKGRRIAFTKGSSAHNVVIAALEKAGLAYADITPTYLSPADAGAAFARDSVDAWAVWDPFFAIAEKQQGARVLVNATDVAKTFSFYIANREIAARYPKLVSEALEGLAEAANWAESNRDEVARALAAVTGVSIEAQTIAANRATFPFGRVTEEIIVSQQAVADRYHKLGLIPRPIVVREAVWTPPAT